MPESDSPAPDRSGWPSDEESAVAPPRMTILSDHPILRDDDRGTPLGREPDSFGLQSRLASVYDILRHKNTRTPIAVAIYGDWGTGKSSAMRWLSDRLAIWGERSEHERKGHARLRTVWFDPWKYQKREDVWRGLIAEVILNAIDVENASLATVANAAKKFGLFLGRSFLNVLSGAKLKAGAKEVGGEVEVNLDVLKKIAEDYHRTAHPEKAYLNEFETALKDWVRDSLKGDERMVVFIDDLDRCLPEVTFEVLEALKLYLNIPKLIFVVGLDRQVVEAYVRHHYKANDLDQRKAERYLDKMFQVEVDIPPSQMQIQDYLPRQIESLDAACDGYWSANLDGWNGEYRRIVEEEIRSLAEHNPREIKRLLNSALLRATAAAQNPKLGGDEAQRFTQGAQVFLVQRVLRRDVPNSAGLMLEQAALDFFERWSAFVGKYPEFRTRKEPLSTQERAASRRVLSELPVVGDADVAESPAAEKRATEDYEGLRALQPRYRDKDEAYPLLQNNDLWDLLEIPFSAAVAAAAATDRKAPEGASGGGLAGGEMPAAAAPSAAAALPEVRAAAGDVIVSLPRAVLSAIAKSLEKDVNQVADADLSAVSALDLEAADLKDLTFVKDLKNLTKLNVSGTQVADVSPLATLQNLQSLYLSGTQVADVSPLATLQNLQYLFLAGTQVADVSPLATLQNLQGLFLAGTQVADVSPLAKLQNLQSLYLSGTQVADVSPLATLQNLQYLFLAGTQVADVSPLAKLQNLQSLSLAGTRVADVSPLAKLQKLQYLNLRGTQVADVWPLATLQNLQRLSLSGTQVSHAQVDHLTKSCPNLQVSGP